MKKGVIQANKRAQRSAGFVLVAALVVLFVITVLGISSMDVASLQLKVAGNTQNANRVAQSASSAIDNLIYKPINFDEDTPFKINGVEINGVETVATINDARVAAIPADCFGSSLQLSCYAYEIDMEASLNEVLEEQVQGFVIIGPALDN